MSFSDPSFWHIVGLFLASCWFLAVFITQIILHLNLHGTCVADEKTGKIEYKKHPDKEGAFAVVVTGTISALLPLWVLLGIMIFKYIKNKSPKKAGGG